MSPLQVTPLAALVAAAMLAGCGERAGTDSTAAPPATSTTAPPATTGASPAPISGGSATPGGAGSGSGSAATGPGMAGGSPAQAETTTAAAGPGTAAGGTPAGSIDGAGPALALVDRNFVTTAAADGMFEVEAAKVASEKATDPAVKAFASMLVEHHTKVNEELKALASTKNVTLPSELPTDRQAELEKLRSVSGAAFDRQFVREVGIKDHQADIRSFEKASRDAKDPQVKAWAAKTLPTLREHYAQAQTLPGGGSKEKTTSRTPTTHDGAETRGAVAGSTGSATGGTTGGTGSATGTAGAIPAGSDSATPPPPTGR